jgi:hypothetical protein
VLEQFLGQDRAAKRNDSGEQNPSCNGVETVFH